MTLETRSNLANVYRKQGRYDESESLVLETLEIQERILGNEHPSTLETRSNLANLFRNQGRYDEAEPLAIETLEVQRRVLGEEHPETLLTAMHLASIYRERDRLTESLALQDHAVAASHHVWPEGSPYLGSFLGQHAATLVLLRRYQAAEAELLEAHDVLVNSVGPVHELTIEVIGWLAELYDAWSRPVQAVEWRALLPTE